MNSALFADGMCQDETGHVTHCGEVVMSTEHNWQAARGKFLCQDLVNRRQYLPEDMYQAEDESILVFQRL